MRYLLTLCLALSLGSCAGKNLPEPPQPINGRCGIVQDACLVGNPSGTGETAAPYGWMCLGRYGGMNDTCSVPTARIEKDEIFAGQNALEEKVKAAGPLRGFLTISDYSIVHPNCHPPDCHAILMRDSVLKMGVPEENVRVTPDFLDFMDPSYFRDTLVFNFPSAIARDLAFEELDIIRRRNNFLTVAAAGNTETNDDRRDLWYSNHPWWKTEENKPYPYWENAFAAFATGRFILAKYAKIAFDGTVVPLEGNVKCGLAKDSCYSIISSPENRRLGTSSASARLSALTFYLFQLWDTPREVVGVLNVCAEDVGDPGVDEEFGRGIVSVVCDTVQNRERRVVSSSMQVSNAASPVFAEMVGSRDVSGIMPQSLFSGQSPERFRPFYAFRGHTFRTATGHAGGRFSLGETDLFVSGGADYAPLGVRSSLLRVSRSPFAEFGTRRNLFSAGGHAVSLLGSYGYGGRNGLSVHAGHLGVRYERRFGSGALSLHAGYRRVRGTVGIPGHHLANAEPVAFADGNPEVRFSFSLGRPGSIDRTPAPTAARCC